MIRIGRQQNLTETKILVRLVLYSSLCCSLNLLTVELSALAVVQTKMTTTRATLWSPQPQTWRHVSCHLGKAWLPVIFAYFPHSLWPEYIQYYGKPADLGV